MHLMRILGASRADSEASPAAFATLLIPAAQVGGGGQWGGWLLALVAVAALFLIGRIVAGPLGLRRTSPPRGDGPFLVFPAPPAGAAPLVPPQPVPVVHEQDEIIEGSTIRFHRAAEGTVQFLPGRLEILNGDTQGQEIRFVRASPGPQEVTFGRAEGEPYRHIQLREPTVSRRHARMSYEGEQWSIHNLSHTNPVTVNGQDLVNGDGRPLATGDRVEMGEITFTFHER